MKRLLGLMVYFGLGMMTYFTYNVFRLYYFSFGDTPITDRELRVSLNSHSREPEHTLGDVFQKLTRSTGMNSSARMARAPADHAVKKGVSALGTSVDAAALLPHEAFDALKDRLEGRVAADQASLVGLMTRMTAIKEPSTEISEYVLGELMTGKSKAYFDDRAMEARYFQSAANVLIQTSGDAERSAENMVRVVAAQDDVELRRVLAVTYIEKFPERQELFLKTLEARKVFNPLVVQDPTSNSGP